MAPDTRSSAPATPVPAARPGPARTSLTRGGQGVAAAGVLLTGGGWAAGYPEPAAAGVCALLAVAFAVLWTLPAPGVAAERRLTPPHSERGGQVVATVRVRRTSGRGRAGLRLVDRRGGERLEAALPLPPPGRTGVLDYPVPTPDRGRIAMGPLEIVVADPFGLCRRVHPCGGDSFLLVRPRTAPLAVTTSGREPRLDGATSGAVHGATAAFHALRAYVPGDDRRMVHWRSTARTGTLMVRQMADVSLPRTTVLLDTDPGHYPAEDPGSPRDFETAVEVCASVAAAAAGGNFPVRVVTDEGPLLRGIDNATPDALLDALALVALGGPGALDRAVRALGQVPPGGSLVAVVGPAVPAAASTALARARTDFSGVVVVRIGAADTPAPAGLRVVDIARLSDLPAAWRRVPVR